MLQVGPVIIWLVIGGVAFIEDKWVYVVVSEEICGPIITVDFLTVKEEDQGLILIAPQFLLKTLIAFIQPSMSIYPDGVLWNSQSLGRFQ